MNGKIFDSAKDFVALIQRYITEEGKSWRSITDINQLLPEDQEAVTNLMDAVGFSNPMARLQTVIRSEKERGFYPECSLFDLQNPNGHTDQYATSWLNEVFDHVYLALMKHEESLADLVNWVAEEVNQQLNAASQGCAT